MNRDIAGDEHEVLPHEIAVLLVDDEQLVLQSLRNQYRRLIGDSDIAVECAGSVSEAWEVIEDLQEVGVQVVLVVSDWLMPSTRGDVFLADVQTRMPSIKRVLLTGQADHDVLRRVVAHGIADLLIFKPWSELDLRDTLALVLAA